MFGNNGSGSVVWIVSDEVVLMDRIELVIRPIPDQVVRVGKIELEEESFFWGPSGRIQGAREEARLEEESYFWGPVPSFPDLIILDVESNVDWGLWAIKRLKKARIKAPVVVVTNTFSREFGEKILTEGVRYYFSHDFSAAEFQEVVESLLKVKQRRVG